MGYHAPLGDAPHSLRNAAVCDFLLLIDVKQSDVTLTPLRLPSVKNMIPNSEYFFRYKRAPTLILYSGFTML
ncbi:hypothetical protein TNCV_4046821 [Trichonephila clavipes]|nr:hypothetical protein TNCV_4046821 [Trichonephila clavipes]